MKKAIFVILTILAIGLIWFGFFASSSSICTKAGYKKSLASSCCAGLEETHEDGNLITGDIYCTIEEQDLSGDCISAGQCYHVMMTESECCDGLSFIFTSKSSGCCVYQSGV